MRTSHAFDGVADFDRAVADPLLPNNMDPGLTGDGLHGSDAGYQAMADAINLSLLR
jgi:lysophospholipase L1-like esterase